MKSCKGVMEEYNQCMRDYRARKEGQEHAAAADVAPARGVAGGKEDGCADAAPG
eukprot:CAMPEP_0114608810 /NCGR_PEP_ID=MMETSP0168-20121206/2769_1 /TAXON_ID=95228 ORGANISM="Vannella sp., Strain DIVA3 517/6/12" /NCGR_SAMPLE_ID=MMETSP0168 /ASSEMBLY_ACC=CAM_ASM_000044 /LENGTH=53 /DNA_ID=CAMNT_0001819717 /DNA_START=93 /DNA_END=251 /DNA_ORIENTATION=+